MEHHKSLGATDAERKLLLFRLIRNGSIRSGGNKILKIYGTLRCRSGKRMKTENRVFFSSGQEAVAAGYRPCGHCMRDEYLVWKTNQAKDLKDRLRHR